MSVIVRKSVTLVLIALLAVISGVGEGLHLIPGCGHGVAVGDRVLLLGIDRPDVPPSDNGHSQVGLPQGVRIPVFAEEQCVVCSAISQNCTLSDAPPVVLVQHLVQEVPLPSLADTSINLAHSFQARAPPLT